MDTRERQPFEQKMPPERVMVMQDYVRHLRKRYPRKSLDWITKQTARHFKIKLT